MNALAIAFVASQTLALAQNPPATPGGIDAHGFVLASHDYDPRNPLTFNRPGAFHQGDFYLALLGEWAESPLVAVTKGTAPGAQATTRPALDDVLAANIGFGVAVHDRIRLDVGMPVYFVSRGTSGDLQDPAPGTLRGSATVILVRPVHVVGGGGLGFGITGHVDAPTGDTTKFVGQEGVAGGGEAAITYEIEGFTGSAGVGTQFAPAVRFASGEFNPSGAVGYASLGYLFGQTAGFTVEGHKLLPLESNSRQTNAPAEVLGSINVQLPSGVGLTFGGAAGVSQGVGSAVYRGFLGLGYAHVKPPRARAKDVMGDLDILDKCPNEPENKNGWKDDDGCADTLGALEIRAVYQGRDVPGTDIEANGPGETAKERTTEKPVSINAVPGSQWTAKAINDAQCLSGTGAITVGESSTDFAIVMQLVNDANVRYEIHGPAGEPLKIAVSTEAPKVTWKSNYPTCVPTAPYLLSLDGTGAHPIGHGKHTAVVEVPGYKPAEVPVDILPGETEVIALNLTPSLVVMTKTQIQILDKVYFETNKAVIKPESFGLLNEVASTINTHPDIGRIEVAGHTDDVGNDKYNMDLSQRRAESVRTYLTQQGVPGTQLIAHGFGETKPIDTNKTDAGRQNNRRVEFNLLDQAPPPPGTP